MRNPHGSGVMTTPEKTIERDSVTCAHCQHVFYVKPGQRPEDIGGLCKSCMQLICPRCYATPGCRPVEKWLEEQERLIARAIERVRAVGEYIGLSR